MKNFATFLQLAIPVSLIFFLASGCSTDRFSGFEKADNGVYYKVHQLSGDTLHPGETDWVTVKMDYRLEDTVLFSYQSLDKPLRFSMIQPEFEGDIYHAFELMSVGDSMTIAIVADSFFYKTAKMQELPDYVEPGSLMYYDIKLTEILSDEEFQAELEAEKERLLKEEMNELNRYVDSANITQQPRASGLYFIPLKTGTGKQPDTGDMCRIHLRVSQLNGPLLYDNFDGEPIEVEYGKQFDTKGFQEGLGLLREGGKARLIVPSPIGVGEQGRELVPPFSTVIYDMELVGIVSMEEVKAARARRKAARERENERLKEVEPKKIQAYLLQNDIAVEPQPSGLYFIEREEGSGAIPVPGDKVKVHYILTRLDGMELQNSYKMGEPYEFILGRGQVIKAWDEAIAMMRRGSKATIIAPSNLAYGKRGQGREIGPYTTLVFDLELIED